MLMRDLHSGPMLSSSVITQNILTCRNWAAAFLEDSDCGKHVCSQELRMNSKNQTKNKDDVTLVLFEKPEFIQVSSGPFI